MSSGILQRNEAGTEGRSARAEPSRRSWNAIGVGLAAALALVGIYGIAIWAAVLLVQALV